MKQKGVSLRGLAVVFFILMAGLLLLFAHAIHQAEVSVFAQLRIEQERRLGRRPVSRWPMGRII